MTLLDENEPEVGARLRQRLVDLPDLAGLIEAVRGSDTPFRLEAAGDLELAAVNEIRSLPNRARMRVVSYGDGAMAVFFYRASLLPGDHFGYGGIAFRAGKVRPDQFQAWVEFVASGLDRDQAPRGLRREHQFPLPETGTSA